MDDAGFGGWLEASSVMNRIFSVVWNTSLRCWVVASELADKKTRSGPAPQRATMAAVVVALSSGTLSPGAMAATNLGGGSSAADFSIAISGGSTTTASNISIAIGDAAVASGSNSIALGRQINVTGNNATGIGWGVGVAATDATALGANASITSAGTAGLALGSAASVTSANGVALGSNSSAKGTTLTNAAYGVGGTATAGGEVNIANGADGRRITGLAAGSSGTDAVNVNQLNKVGQDTATALGGGAALNATTGAWTAPSYSTNSISATGANTGPLVSTNVGAALSNLNTSVTNTAAVAVKYDNVATKTQVTFNPAGAAVKLTNIAIGALNATSTDAVNGSQLFANSQNTASALGGGAAVNAATGAWTAPSYSTNSISVTGANTGPLVSTNVGAALTNLNTSVTNTAAVAVKYDDAATKTQVTFNPAGTSVKLTNVAAGALNATSTDAVNGSQLFANSQNMASALGGGAAVNAATGAWTAPSYSTNSISTTGANTGPLVSTNVGAALTNLNTSVTNTAAVAVKYDDPVTKTQVTFNPAGTSVKLTNVAAGVLNATSTDAVNGSQLFANSQNTASALGGGAAVNATTGAWTAPSYSTNSIGVTGANTGPLVSSDVGAALTNLNTSVTNTAAVAVKYDDATTKTQVTFNPAGTAVKLTNVAAGVLNATSTDAVNGSQLFATNQTVDNMVNNGAGIKYFHGNSTLADSSATGQDSVAIGPLASATIANGVALGSNSSATGATLGNAAYGVGGTATGGEVNIANGADGRRLTGLAAGSSATDAVNVSQLNKAGQDTATALGGGAALDANTGAWTAPSYSTNSISATGANTGPLLSTNVGAALTNLNTSVTNTAAVAVKYDDAATKTQVTFNPAGTSVKLTNVAAGVLNATSTDAVNGSQLFANSQNTASALGGGAAVNATTGAWTAPSYSTNSISATGANTGPLVSSDVGAALSNLNTSVTNTAAVAVKYDDAATKTQVTFNPAGTAVKLTNVAAGALNATSTDAVNGSQLFATNQTVDSLVNNGAGIKYFHGNSTLADSSATGQDSVAIGPLASATIANGVALGSNSSATGATLGNAAYGVGGTATGGEVNIANGADGRRLTGLAAGSSATDAVNVSQLNKAGQDTATALGGGAALDANTGAWTAPSYSTNSISTTGANTGPLVSTNVGAALTNLNTSVTNTAAVAVKYDDAATKTQVTFNPAGTAVKLTNVAAGTLNATSTDAVNGSQLFATNQTVDSLVNNGAGIKYFHGNSTLADSSATGQDSVAIGPLASATIANGVALGSNSSATGATLGNAAYGVGGTATVGGEVNIANGADGRRLTGLAAGSSATDAVNVSQLNKAGQDTATALGGGAALDANTGAWTAPSYSTNSISTTGANTGPLLSTNVGAALTNLNTSVTNTAAVAVKYDDAATKTQVTFNPAGTAVKLTNVAAGALNATSTDAVNGSQLFATNQTVDSLVNNGAGIKYFHSNSTLADSSATGQDSIAIGPLASATIANGVALGSNSSATGATLGNAAYGVGGTATGGEVNIANGADGRRLTGLAAGSSATDAVNVSQLNKAGQDTATALGGGAALDANTGAWTAPSYSTNSISATGANTGPLLSTNVGAALTNLNTSVTNTAAVAVKYDDAATKTQVTFNPAGTAVKLTNVAAGALNATSTDAVNGSQLFATNQTVDSLVNNGAGIKYFHGNSTLADSSATGQDSVAIGPLASATIANGVALGSNSSATGATLGNAAYGVGGTATVGGEVNIANGADGRRLTGLAAGSSATDAVNVSQLNKAGQDTATALGGGATLDANTGSWTAPSYSTNSISATGANTGPLVSTNVGAALTNLNTSVTNTAAVAVKYDDAATKTQVTFNPAGTSVKLTNVAAGALNATSTDAVNGSQLFATNQTVDNLVNNGAGIKYFHSNSTLADAQANGQDSVAMGPGAISGGTNSIALGNGATASFANSIALGAASSATGSTLGNAAYGVGGTATVGGEVNIANGADGRRLTGLAAGSSATDAVNVSQLNKAGQDTATALGGGATLDANTGSWTAPSYSTNSISATGANTGPLVSNNVGAALTNLNTSVTNTAAVAVKYDDAATKTQVTFNPAGTSVKLTNVAAGALNATSTDAVNGSQLFATNQTVDNLVNNGAGIKYFHSNSTLADAQANGQDSIAIGPQSIAAGVNSFAAGSGARASADGALALGRLSQAQVAGGIALGEGSVADRVLAPTTGSIAAGAGTIIYDTSDATLLGSVSVGKAGSYRQITNVADATEDHDAVTLRQLTGAMGSLSSTGTMYFHANSTNPTDSLASGAESVAVGPGTVVNGDNGIGLGNQANVSQAAAGGIAIGRNTQVLLASGIAMGSAAQAAAEQAVALGAGANASHAMSVALGSSSLTTVGAETGYSAYRLAGPQTSVGEVGIGTALGSRKITGLAAGTQDNDAVNVAQLKAVGDQVDQNTTDITNLGGRVGGLETLIGAGGGIKYLHVNSTRADSSATGTDAMALGAQAQASGTGSVAVGSGATASAGGSVALGSGASDDGRGAETYSGKYSGANNVTSGTVSVGNATTGETRTVSNVADGKNANDAVNVRQLDGAVAEAKQYTDDSIANLGANAGQQDGRITSVEGDVANIKNGTDGMFQVSNGSAAAKPKATGVDSLAGGAGAVASGKNSAAVGTRSQASGENSVALGNGAKASARNATALGANSVADRDNSVSVGSSGNERQLTNLAAGTRGTDAVNLDQLNSSVADITANANAYTDSRYMELKNDLKQQDEILSAGIAGAMAMASLPQSYSPGSSMTVAAAGTYRGQSSLAFGVSHMSANGRWVTKLQGSTDTQRKVGVAVGIGYQW
ncbi:YadA-like family protein [Pseudomonas sp. NPDC089534]|uniref:YadA-like family protein n=1 Tax=Pseudomonas sp. NPDC089534 TaxID=3364468 RepID=UPI00381CA3A5